MTTYLQPALSGHQLTVDAALKSPTTLARQIGRLVDRDLLLPRFCHQLGAPVTGGGMVYSTITADNLYVATVEQRQPGDEYPSTTGELPEPRLALVEDWGAKFRVPHEDRTRNNVSLLDQQTRQLANTLVRKLDERLLAKLGDVIGGDQTVPGHDWDQVLTVGPADSLTPSAGLPTADLALAQLVADRSELGVRLDTLIVHPDQAAALRIAYAEKLAGMLTSAGVNLVVNPRLTAGTAWVIEAGKVGTVGFEYPLTVDVWEDKPTRSTVVQAFVVPAIAVDRPECSVRLTGLAA